jgi:hypothetical protein
MIGLGGYDHITHFYRRNYIDKNYRINLMMKIPKFAYLNLNIYK